MPPTVAAYTSRPPTFTCARSSRTARVIDVRAESKPLVTRRAFPKSFSRPALTNAWISASSGLRPSSVTVTHVPGTGSLWRDVYAATVGGMKMSEPAADLALALSVASAAKGLALPADLVAIGEVGLAGEIRKVSGVERRLAEAFRLGFKRALVPAGSDVKIAGMEIVEVSRLDQALTRVKINGE